MATDRYASHVWRAVTFGTNCHHLWHTRQPTPST